MNYIILYSILLSQKLGGGNYYKAVLKHYLPPRCPVPPCSPTLQEAVASVAVSVVSAISETWEVGCGISSISVPKTFRTVEVTGKPLDKFSKMGEWGWNWDV
jgi:hypothetical protein